MSLRGRRRRLIRRGASEDQKFRNVVDRSFAKSFAQETRSRAAVVESYAEREIQFARNLKQRSEAYALVDNPPEPHLQPKTTMTDEEIAEREKLGSLFKRMGDVLTRQANMTRGVASSIATEFTECLDRVFLDDARVGKMTAEYESTLKQFATEKRKLDQMEEELKKAVSITMNTTEMKKKARMQKIEDAKRSMWQKQQHRFSTLQRYAMYVETKMLDELQYQLNLVDQNFVNLSYHYIDRVAKFHSNMLTMWKKMKADFEVDDAIENETPAKREFDTMVVIDSIRPLFLGASEKVLFGVPLEQVMARKSEVGVRVPEFVTLMTDYVRTILTKEGIFRLPGKKEEIAALRQQADLGQLEAFEGLKTANSVCSLLKEYVRELPREFSPLELYTPLLEAPEDEQLAIAKQGLESRNIWDQLLLHELFRLFQEIAANSEVNKMSASNLAVCWGMNIFKEMEFTGMPTPQQLMQAQKSNDQKIGVFTFFVDHYEELFSNPPEPPAHEDLVYEITQQEAKSLKKALHASSRAGAAPMAPMTSRLSARPTDMPVLLEEAEEEGETTGVKLPTPTTTTAAGPESSSPPRPPRGPPKRPATRPTKPSPKRVRPQPAQSERDLPEPKVVFMQDPPSSSVPRAKPAPPKPEPITPGLINDEVDSGAPLKKMIRLPLDLLVTADVNGRVCGWQLSGEGLPTEPTWTHQVPGEIVVMEKVDDEHFVTVGKDSPEVQVWKTGEEAPFRVLTGFNYPPHAVHVHPEDSAYLIIAENQTLWCYHNFQLSHKFEDKHQSRIRNVFTSTGSLYSITESDGVVYQWTHGSAECVATLSLRREKICCGCMSRSEPADFLACTTTGKYVVWKDGASSMVDTFKSHTIQEMHELSPEKESFLIVFDAGRRDYVSLCIGQCGVMASIPFRGKVVGIRCLSEVEGTYVVWDKKNVIAVMKQSSSVKKFTGHRGLISNIETVVDGTTLASAAEDGKLRLWSLEDL